MFTATINGTQAKKLPSVQKRCREKEGEENTRKRNNIDSEQIFEEYIDTLSE